jgi:tetratricopeptide (TPR) repeat protein
MEERATHTTTLKNTCEGDEYTLLRSLSASESWDHFSEEEKEHLAHRFIDWGQHLLKNNDPYAVKALDTGDKLAPTTHALLLRQGCCWYNYAYKHKNMKSFFKAEDFFQKALKHTATSCEAWFYLGKVFSNMAMLQQDMSFFQKAHHAYEQVEKYLSHGPVTYSELMWQWGRSYYFLGKISGEIVDFHTALNSYKNAQDIIKSDLFWNDYGNAFVEVGCLINDTQHLMEALACYKKCVSRCSENFEGWLNAACTAQRLFYITSQDTFFTYANKAFSKATSLLPSNVNAWFKWGELLLTLGKHTHNLTSIQESIQRFKRAYECEEGNDIVLCRWAEAELLLGKYMENLSLLKSAEKKIMKSLSQESSSSTAWYLYGECLKELGIYFDDERYLHESLTKFHRGMTIDENDPLLWFGIGYVSYLLGDRTEDPDLLKQSVSYYDKLENENLHFNKSILYWGVALMKTGLVTEEVSYLEKALSCFSRISTTSKDHLEGLYHRGCALDILGEMTNDERYYEEAIETLSSLIAIQPDNDNAHFNLALALTHLGEATDIVEHLEKAFRHYGILIKMDKEDSEAWHEWGVALLSMAHLIRDDINTEEYMYYCYEAEKKLRYAVALGNDEALYYLACAYSMSGYYDMSFETLERALESDFPPPMSALMDDEWLENIRPTEEFKSFVKMYANTTEDDL